jgi:hypothetical protein
VSQKFTAMLVDDKDKTALEIDRAQYARTQKQLNRAVSAEAKTRRRMLRAVGAGPTMLPDPGGEAADPESEQQS